MLGLLIISISGDLDLLRDLLPDPVRADPAHLLLLLTDLINPHPQLLNNPRTPPPPPAAKKSVQPRSGDMYISGKKTPQGPFE